MKLNDKMRSVLRVASLCLLGVGSALTYSCISNLRPAVAVDTETCDFGTIAPGQVVEKTVRVQNVGRKELVIGTVQASCGCTAAYIGSTRIPPRKESALTIRLQGGSKLGELSENVTWKATIHCSQPSTCGSGRS